MSDTYTFARLILLAAGVGLVALLSNRLTERIKIPAPLLVLVAATIAVTRFRTCTHRPNGWWSGW
jgi:cell volume regulation protein A